MGFPVGEAARVTMRTFRDFLRTQAEAFWEAEVKEEEDIHCYGGSLIRGLFTILFDFDFVLILF